MEGEGEPSTASIDSLQTFWLFLSPRSVWRVDVQRLPNLSKDIQQDPESGFRRWGAVAKRKDKGERTARGGAVELGTGRYWLASVASDRQGRHSTGKKTTSG